MKKINVSELRLGNVINGVYQLEESNDMHYTLCSFSGYNTFDNYVHVESEDGIEEFIHFEPIPISEEILLKCGFVNEFSNSWSDHILQIFENKGNVAGADIGDFYVSTGQRYVTNFKYLHQLQNLYFALCNQELNTSGL